MLSGILIFLVFSGISVILWIGGQDLMAGRISPGDLSSFIFYAFLVASSTGFLSELAVDLRGGAQLKGWCAGAGRPRNFNEVQEPRRAGRTAALGYNGAARRRPGPAARADRGASGS